MSKWCRGRDLLLLPMLLASCLTAHAACSRTINVPVAAVGLSVIASGENISGIYPEILRSLSAKEGCQFNFSLVPRARLELMFENGQADLLLPAIRTSRRDEHGTFVPLIYTRATLISLQSNRPQLRSAQELLEQRGLKVALVRGYDYGDGYQAIMAELGKQGRLTLEADALSVARTLKAGAVDLTIMAPYIFAGAVQSDPRVEGMADKLRFEPIAELPWGDSGVYMSKKSLSADDKAALQGLLEAAARSGEVWKNFQRYYKPEVLKDGNRPREPGR
ncbi:MAG: transporter substrate-binding domain-containing protein [Burkholderiales bacterium]|nr:transporter substrate-binding domain-containing protein [Burkholderiales bacterium]